MTIMTGQGAHEGDSANDLDGLERLTIDGLAAIQDGISDGSLVFTEFSVIFICNLEWERARQMVYCLMEAEKIVDAVRDTRNSCGRTTIICPCASETAAEILSTKFGSLDLAMRLNEGLLESVNLWLVIIPTETKMAISYIEIP